MRTHFATKREAIDWLLREKYPGFLAAPKKYLPQIHRDLKRLAQGEPLAYVIGWVNFLGCKIDLSSRPLIPRPETEYWTEKAIGEMKSRKGRVKCLDIFSGSGCIGIAVLKHIPGARVWLADDDPRCLQQIRKNLKLNGISAERYRIKLSNVLKNVKTSFDYILANPPYLPLSRKSKLSVAVRKYEKPHALFGGGDGLKYVRRLLKEAIGHLKADGELWLEFDSSQKEQISCLAQKYGYKSCSLLKDQFGRCRWAILKK